jgi:hypothetical protein
LVFENNANLFTENCPKSQKILIITSTPDWANFRLLGKVFGMLLPTEKAMHALILTKQRIGPHFG